MVHTKLALFTAMGRPDVVLRVTDSGDLPAHSELLNVYSNVLRDVIRGTSSIQRIAESDDDFPASIIPLGAGDALTWSRSLAALYEFADGVPDDDVWKSIMVREQGASHRFASTRSFHYYIHIQGE